MNIRASADFKPGNYAAFEAQIVPRIIAATRAATAAVAVEARALCPVDSGELQGSIGTEVVLSRQEVDGAIFAAAPYAAFVEYGTGLVGEAAPHGALPTQGVPYTGNWVYDYKRQNWRGMPAHPFLRPAVDGSFGVIMDSYRAQGFVV